jgi:hypothetical protein
MRRMVMIALFTATGCWAQEPATPPASSPAAQEQVPAPAQKSTITVPAGTRIPLKLTYTLWSKTARIGDAVHAVTVFPVTVDTTVAIPEGTYAEGVVDKVWRRASANHPTLQMHFTRLLFANGYAVPLDGAMTEVKVEKPDAVPSATSADLGSVQSNPLPESQSMLVNSFGAQQQPPTLPPPPKVGPNMGTVIGATLGGAAALLVTAILLGHHRGGYTVLDAGSQVDMVLQNPLTLDAEQVAAALATPSVQ